MEKLNTKYFTAFLVLFIIGCEAPVKTVGFNTWENYSDSKFTIGSEESIETALAFNEAWDNRDFEEAKSLSTDSIRFVIGDGIPRDWDYVIEVNNYRDSVRAANGATVESEIKRVFSIQLEPNKTGTEAVHASIVYTYESDTEYNQWRQYETFFIRDGKVRRWSATGQDIVEDDE